MGLTGARGWMWAMRLRVDLARQILITKIDKGSPADGVLMVGDEQYLPMVRELARSLKVEDAMNMSSWNMG